MSRPSTRAKIDWGTALAWFVAMPKPRSYGAVARQFGVSDTSVRVHAKREHWEQVAADIDAKAAEKELAGAARTVEQRRAQLLRIYDRASDLVETGLDADDPKLTLEQVFARFPDIHRIYRLETDQATDHMALAEVQAGFRSTMAVAIATVELVASELLGERKAREVVQAFRLRFLPAVNEALAVGAGGES